MSTQDPLFHKRAVKVAAAIAGASVDQLVSDWRAPKVLVHARWCVMASMRKRGSSLPQIGRRLGGRDHSTVAYGIDRAEYFAERSPEFRAMLEAVDAA